MTSTETRHYSAPDPTAPTLVLGHGAGAGQDHPWMRRVAGALSARGVHVVTFNFPYMAGGRSVPDKGDVLEAAFQAVWAEVAQTARGPLLAGGKSMGGRIASQAASAKVFEPAPAGLVFFGYPLHPPGKAAQRRDRHLPAITAPMLFLHGTRDPFGSPDELSDLVAALPLATLSIVDGGDHSLVAPKRQDPKGESVEGAVETAVAWIAGLGAVR